MHKPRGKTSAVQRAIKKAVACPYRVATTPPHTTTTAVGQVEK
jgi:hypothetical protein